jgi:hypothetical protein
MGTTTDDRFRAIGGASGVWNYMARGVCEVGYTMLWPVNTFLVGGGFNGVDFGVHATCGPVGDFSQMPPATGYADPAGVEGASALFTGTAGLSTFGTGVYGHKSLPDEDISSIPVAQFAGVLGTAIAWPGVVGWSTIGRGVKGLTYSGEAGVLGQAEQGRGVLGISGQGAFSGVEGRSGDRGPPPGMGIPNVAGVLGTAGTHPGVMGTSSGLMGVYGFSTNNAGVVGQTANPNSFGGFFAGNVMVVGNFTVVNGTKSAAVPFPDGSQRVLYCMESPELWFEDFGTARLKRGRTVVNLDADFGKVVKRGDYRVFLTPEGDCRGLYIRRKSAASFEVRELMRGTSSIAFSYRIVGRRKDVRAQRRFAKIDSKLPLPAAAPSKPTAAGLRKFVARLDREERRRKPKGKGRRSRELPRYLRLRRQIAAAPEPPADTLNK